MNGLSVNEAKFLLLGLVLGAGIVLLGVLGERSEVEVDTYLCTYGQYNPLSNAELKVLLTTKCYANTSNVTNPCILADSTTFLGRIKTTHKAVNEYLVNATGVFNPYSFSS